MSENIPAEVMAAATECSGGILFPSGIEKIARAILAAQAAQREKDAELADKYAKDALAVYEGDAAAAGREIAAAIRNQSHAPDQQAIAGADLCPRETPASQSQEPTE